MIGTIFCHLSSAFPLCLDVKDPVGVAFVSFVRDLNSQTANAAHIFQYYLERHIEVDGDHHSHLAYEMTNQLCGDNAEYWKEATDAVTDALNTRIKLWDAIVSHLNNQN